MTSFASRAPVPWNTTAFYDYLRHGHSREHGSALGPMTAVVRELANVPDADIRAMATYLGSFNEQHLRTTDGSATRASAAAGTLTATVPPPGPGQRLFDHACAACHHDGSGPTLLGTNTSLALSSKLHSDRPDNLIRTIYEGVQQPPGREVGFMAGFREAFDDVQMAQLVGYMRRRFAPDEPAWPALEDTAARLRASPDER